MTRDKKNLEQNQAKNDRAQKELDEELDKALEGEGDAIEDDDVEEEEETPEEEEGEEEEETLKEDDEEEEEEEEEEETPEEEPEKKEEKKPEKRKVARPQKYIPLKKYQEDKKKWKQSIQDIKDAQQVDETKKEKKNRLKKLAEKHDTSIEFLEELTDIIDSGEEVKPEAVIEKKEKKTEIEKKPIEEKTPTNEEIVEQFDSEFDEFSSDLKKQYPKATEEQIAEAKKIMDQHAHTPEFENTILEHILKIKKEDFDAVLGDSPNNQGVEGGRPSGEGFREIKANSFKKDKDGYYNFSSLHKMPEGSKKEKIIDDMPPEQWEAYVNSMGDGNGMQLKKDGGRTINLK